MSAEFLALYFKKDIKTIKKCLKQTAKKHHLTEEEVGNMVVGKKLRSLPPEVMIVMLDFLPTKDILQLCGTSRYFGQYCRDNRLWKHLLKRDYGVEGGDDARKEYIYLAKGIQVSCGNEFTGFVNRGKLYMWGSNRWGQLGKDAKTLRSMSKTPIRILEKMIITQISCGYTHAGAITNDGRLYRWGYYIERDSAGYLLGKVGPITHIPFKEKVVQVSCGDRSTGVVTEGGKLYMWGRNDSGQLGDGTTQTSLSPTHIPIKGKVVQVSCGASHTGAITEDGELYMWGNNNNGQLGDGTGTRRLTPTLNPIEHKVIQVSCGGYHTGVITQEGELYMWGANGYGQLGIKNQANIYKPGLLPIKGKVIQVSCGPNNTGVITEGGKLYMWGSNNSNKLGTGFTLSSNYKPERVLLLEGYGKGILGQKVSHLSCGGNYTGATTDTGQLYMWGANGLGQLGDGTKKKRSLPKLISLTE